MSDDQRSEANEHLELDEDFEEQKHKVDEWEEDMREEREEEE
jgi:hypothetical protein